MTRIQTRCHSRAVPTPTHHVHGVIAPPPHNRCTPQQCRASCSGLDTHPAVPPTASLVRTGAFSSCFRCRAVPCPWGGPEPACEVALLHSEDVKVGG